MTRKKPRQNRKMHGARADKFMLVKSTPRGKKGSEREKLLPPWRDIKDELK